VADKGNEQFTRQAADQFTRQTGGLDALPRKSPCHSLPWVLLSNDGSHAFCNGICNGALKPLTVPHSHFASHATLRSLKCESVVYE